MTDNVSSDAEWLHNFIDMFDEAFGVPLHPDNEERLERIANTLERKDDDVEAIAEIIAPHLRQAVGPNPDCDDQARARDFAMSIARRVAAIGRAETKGPRPVASSGGVRGGKGRGRIG